MTQDDTLTLGKWVFSLSGVVQDFKDVLQRWKAGMAHWSDRGPPDYEDDRENLRDLIRKTVRATVDIQGGYHEGGGGESKWLIPVLVSLTVSFILGGVALTVTVFSLKQEVTDLKVQVDHVEKIVEPRYRGAP